MTATTTMMIRAGSWLFLWCAQIDRWMHTRIFYHPYHFTSHAQIRVLRLEEKKRERQVYKKFRTTEKWRGNAFTACLPSIFVTGKRKWKKLYVFLATENPFFIRGLFQKSHLVFRWRSSVSWEDLEDDDDDDDDQGIATATNLLATTALQILQFFSLLWSNFQGFWCLLRSRRQENKNEHKE